MASLARRGWRRAKSSIAEETAARLAERQAALLGELPQAMKDLCDTLRERQDLVLSQLPAVFAQLTEIANTLASLSSTVDELGKRVSELAGTVAVQVDVENQSTELLGRLLAQARARLDALEEAGRTA